MKTFLATLTLVVAVIASPALVQAAPAANVVEDVGTDPDPFIRSQMLRDHQWKTGGS